MDAGEDYHTHPGCRQREEGGSRVIFRQEFMSGLQLEPGPPLKGWQGSGMRWGRHQQNEGLCAARRLLGEPAFVLKGTVLIKPSVQTWPIWL